MSVPHGHTAQDEFALALVGGPTVGEMPPPTARPSAELLIAHARGGAHVERIRALRTELLLRQRQDENRAIAVVSASPGEGRSRLAAELAIAFAQTGAPTLLVDADLRRGRQAALFGIKPGEGLAETLEGSGSAHLHGVHGLPHLAVVTAGAAPEQPLERLSTARFAELLNAWRGQFQHVILDTPPAHHYADGLAVAALCGAALIVSRAGHTPVSGLRELLRGLSLTPARVLGCALTRF